MSPHPKQAVILAAIVESGTTGMTTSDILELPGFYLNEHYEQIVRDATKYLMATGRVHRTMEKGDARQYRWYAAGIEPHKRRKCLMCGEGFDSHHDGERVCPTCKTTDRWNNGGDAQGVDCGRRL
jgi:hypothetical protein